MKNEVKKHSEWKKKVEKNGKEGIADSVIIFCASV